MDWIPRWLQSIGAPPIFSQELMLNMAEIPTLPPKSAFPDPTFTRIIDADSKSHRVPQAIAHRGYRAQYPENTLSAFQGAVDVGVHALETDVHLSKDGVVVLSHDASLQRCFGIDKKLIDCDWKYIKELRTIKQPQQSPARLEELLTYLVQPQTIHVWLLLDIKMDNDCEDIMRLMSVAIARVAASPERPWKDRIIMGCWAAKYIPLCHKYFPGFPITHIGFSIPYARHFFAVPNVSFNLLQASLVSPSGRRFIRDAKSRGRPIYTWTVNEEKNMDWCIRQGLDGVITDEPKRYLDVCDAYDPLARPPNWAWRTVFEIARINIFAWLFGFLFFRKHGFDLDKRYRQDTM